MYIKTLKIKSFGNIIREINFEKGLNIIVDETSSGDKTKSGNGVGKTTVLKLIDFCFGAKRQSVFNDINDNKNTDTVVKKFLIEKKVEIILFVEEIEKYKSIELRRNFLTNKNALYQINNNFFKNLNDYKNKLKEIFFPDLKYKYPTLRELLSINIRYSNYSLSKTINNISGNTKSEIYEILYLYMFGLAVNGDDKAKIKKDLTNEKKIFKRLEEEKKLGKYKTEFKIICDEIYEIENRKRSLKINPNYQVDIIEYDKIKVLLNNLASDKSLLQIRKSNLEKLTNKIDREKLDVDYKEIKLIYEEAKILNFNVQKKFQEMVNFHNKMIDNKFSYFNSQIDEINIKIDEYNKAISANLNKEKELEEKINKTITSEEFEKIQSKLAENYYRKGEIQKMINLITYSNSLIDQYSSKLEKINYNIYSDEFYNKLQEKVDNFNAFFTKISNELYGKKYSLSVEKPNGAVKSDKKNYIFSCDNLNISPGKKQGEMLSFDLGYVEFAKFNGIPHFDFLLNDEKELMSGNQLIKLYDYLKENNDVQVIIPILMDKLPNELKKPELIKLKLSEETKLFKIE